LDFLKKNSAFCPIFLHSYRTRRAFTFLQKEALFLHEKTNRKRMPTIMSETVPEASASGLIPSSHKNS
jgi:hypothetical protein